MRRRRILGLLLAVGACALAADTQAAPITVAFSGTITEVLDSPDPAVVVGAPFSGTYTIDPSSAFQSPSPLDHQHFLSPPGSISVSIAGVSYASPIEVVYVVNFSGGQPDWWATVADSYPFVPGNINVVVAFEDANGTKLTSTDFFVNQELAGWFLATLSVGRFIDESHNAVLAQGAISTLNVVPEPRTALELLGGLALLTLRRRRSLIS